ncbi:hypothetical protein BVRB_009900 [Beta vulgaris subsp. vulgaris]|uniref:AMP-dependent synthetase/ligase domain-containing protein n=1 Tax=Beta vulgaris subsp. vulgaris TaxID=3555 RepID=A0A0J8B5U8_BETVV|nr:hypothetical protein BVRB_009900 [Beta vulgaris subsp. vulgaris]
MKKWEANYTPLTPITFLQRAAMSYADRNSIIYGGARFTWRQTYDRCRRLASSLRSLGVAKNDVPLKVFADLSCSLAIIFVQKEGMWPRLNFVRACIQQGLVSEMWQTRT